MNDEWFKNLFSLLVEAHVLGLWSNCIDLHLEELPRTLDLALQFQELLECVVEEYDLLCRLVRQHLAYLLEALGAFQKPDNECLQIP